MGAREDHDTVRPIRWVDGALELLDQRALPGKSIHRRFAHAAAVADAIRDMVVRGAPAIGITAAYGVVLAARAAHREFGSGWREAMEPDLMRLRSARPTAINLAWAVERMWRKALAIEGDPTPTLLAEARLIHEEDIRANRAMGALGAALIAPDSAVLTHCNAGSLATGGYGTALGVIRSAYGSGRARTIYADETRPWLQGSRLTAWELLQDGVPVTLVADGAAAWLMRAGGLHWVIVGADRIAANGDVANKIGTYALAVAARYHGVRFMVAAPISTIDLETGSGAEIPIEKRTAQELLCVDGHPVGAQGAEVWNPVFNVTPAELIDAIITERGVLEKPCEDGVRKLMGEAA